MGPKEINMIKYYKNILYLDADFQLLLNKT